MRAPAPVPIGALLAEKYRVERVVGAGGMGTVVLATHLELEHPVAIKFMRPEALEDRFAVERFIREARATARLRSPHVARVMDVGRLPDGVPYLVMEFLHGCDLATYVREQGVVTAEVASDYILQACEGIAEAHDLGIIHRDLKSANLFLTQGRGGAPLIKVLDFGISKVMAAGEQFTITANLMGSPAYMAPEQVRSARTADVRSDVWSLGVVLFELTQGYLPFVTDGSAIGDVCIKVMMDPHPQLHGVPAGFAEIVDRCLQKDPGRRYQTVAELAQALRSQGDNVPGTPRRRARIWLLAAVTIAAIVGMATVAMQQQVPPPPAPPARAPTPARAPDPPPPPAPAVIPVAAPAVPDAAMPAAEAPEPPPVARPPERRKIKTGAPARPIDDDVLRSRH